LRPAEPYYKYVRLPRYLTYQVLLSLVLATACNRGAHPAQTGKPAPDFTVADGTTTVQLSKYRGKVVLLNFWASWCTPCLVELPSLIQLHHDQPNLVILGVSVDEDADAYKSFLVRRHIDFTTVRDPSESAAKLFKTEMWPETYIIDRNGYIRSKYVGATDWSDPEIRAFIKSL
jgi:cytochrome c biogenesis protein CcmG, thiol:disulfide interchange protein DsbE